MAGEATTFEVWGLMGGQQVAYGMTTVTPALHASVSVTVTLSAVSCGPWCTDGDAECMQDGTATCAAQANGCLGWSTVAPCPATAPYCANGACAAQCTDECAMGQTECDSAVTMRTCGPSPTSTCLVWSMPVACASGQTCSGQACATATACATDGAACDDGDACTQDDTCEGGTCSGTPTCTTAPANADPTCSSGTCGFTCHAGYTNTGTSCVLSQQRIFISSLTYDGDLGGLAGADTKCQAMATAANLPGTYKAWLSDSTTAARDRLTHSAGPYVLVDGTIVAESWAGLVSGTLLHAIDKNENGSVSTGQVWTSTADDGTAVVDDQGDVNDCDEWNNFNADFAVPGLGSSATSTWTSDELDACTAIYSLYCVEQ